MDQAILPRFPPEGRALLGIAIGMRVLPKRNVMLAPAEALRRNDDEAMEYQPEPGGNWLPVPSGTVTHPLEEPVPPGMCDVELVPVVQYANTTITDKQGRMLGGVYVPERVTLARFDFTAFAEACERALPTGKGLVVVP